MSRLEAYMSKYSNLQSGIHAVTQAYSNVRVCKYIYTEYLLKHDNDEGRLTDLIYKF